jgi:hypothetical protein
MLKPEMVPTMQPTREALDQVLQSAMGMTTEQRTLPMKSWI